MDITTYLIIIFVFYIVLLFFDNFFKTCAHYPYVQFLKNTGIEIGLFRLKWNTTFFNRLILRIGSSRTRMLYYWFETGLYISLLLLPIAVLLLLIANIQLFTSSSIDQNQLVLEPVILGYHIPASEIGYYSLVLLICSVVHEIGHGLAAVKEDVHVIDTGINVLFFIPFAYINISTEKYSSISQWRILRILCAGIWHNVVLMLIAGLVYTCLPVLLTPFYEMDAGVMVTQVSAKSHLMGSLGLKSNDIVTRINDCVVTDELSWQHCLSLSRVVKPGYCVSTDLVHELDESGPFIQLENGIWDCCNPNSPKHLCFEYFEKSEGIAELPQHMCLPARKLVEESRSYCFVEKRQCPDSTHCIRPLLSNDTSLIVLKRKRDLNVIYIGHPADIFLTIQISPFIPKYKFLSTDIALIINKIIKYITVFSGGFAIINVLPCIFFDGQHIVNALTIILFKNRVKKQYLSTISDTTVILGTFMLILFFIYYLWLISYKM